MVDKYQILINEMFSKHRSNPNYTVYPSYHEGLYLEDYFFNYFKKNNENSSRYYIPVSWTTCYNDNIIENLQNLLNSLDSTKKYFAVSQHDDAIREVLPKDTIHFNAGGNAGGIPIPLICSPIKSKVDKDKDIFCSFVGSITHPIRLEMYNQLVNNSKYLINAKNWSISISQNELNNFIDITSRSIFCLAPRGYGRSSFRLYEAIQLGSIPVYIYDDKWIPFEDEIDWESFSVLIHHTDLKNIDNILLSYSEDRIKEMQNNLEYYWQNYFTMDSVCKKILKRI